MTIPGIIFIAAIILVWLGFLVYVVCRERNADRIERLQWFSESANGPMTFEQFVYWINNRACDGRWGFGEAITCIEVYHYVKGKHKDEQEIVWKELWDENPTLRKMIEETNRKIIQQDLAK